MQGRQSLNPMHGPDLKGAVLQACQMLLMATGVLELMMI